MPNDLDPVDKALEVLRSNLSTANPHQLDQLEELGRDARIIRRSAQLALASTDPFRAPVVFSAETREHHRLIDRFQLERLFALEQRRYEFYGLNARVQVPTTFDQILEILSFNKLRNAEKEDLKDPRLIVLEKEFCLDDLGESLAAKNESIYIYNYGERKPRYSEVYLMDGLAEMDPLEGDNLMWNMDPRLDFFSRYKRIKGFTGMNNLKVYHFYMQSRFEGRKIDILNKTILDEEPIRDGGRYIPTFCGNIPDLLHSCCYPDLPDASTNFRRTLGGRVLKGWRSSLRRALGRG